MTRRQGVPVLQSQSRTRGGVLNHGFRGRSLGISETGEEDGRQHEDDQREIDQQQYDEQHDDGEIEGIEREGEVKTLDHNANDLVRLALSTEYRRMPLKRDEIVKKVFGGHVAKGEFGLVLERAQEILRDILGMELHEIMSRAERDKVDADRYRGEQPHGGEAAVVGIKKKGSTTSSKQYILRSLLSNSIIERASQYDPDIEAAEQGEVMLWVADDESCRYEGSLLSWRHTSRDQLILTGILHVLLALILVNGRVLPDMQLRTYIKRLRLPMGSVIPSNATSQTVKPTTIDVYLAQLVKQSYLEKQKAALTSAQSGQKRARRGGVVGGAEDGETSFEWRWGIRAFAEIGEESIADFVADFLGDIERERESQRMECASLQGKGQVERGQIQKRRERVVTTIGRAAGSRLIPYK